jgi:starch synthase
MTATAKLEPASVSGRDVKAYPLHTADGQSVRVLHLVAELAPFARSGGLGEAVASLARFQAASGLWVGIIMPLYEAVKLSTPEIEPLGPAFRVQVGPRSEQVRLWRYVAPPNDPLKDAHVYFIESMVYFDRSYIYGPPGSDYFDNAERYACFCMAALTAMPRIVGANPVVVHAHDWHAALAPVYGRSVLAGDHRYDRARFVLSVHNAGFQGHFPQSTMADLGLPMSLYNWRQLEWHGRLNLLKGGLVFADAATTVSPTHAHELRTPAGGFGLDGVFISLRDRFVGITNGIDQQQWNPATDPLIAANYSVDSPAGKRACREALQVETSLRPLENVPIFAMSARLVSQKGLDLILGDPGYFALDAQFVFLGSGEPRYAEALTAIAERAPSRISVQLQFSEALEHRLLAGADMCLMPSQYEPCGLTQMRAQRYGTIPIARRVGGLADTIEDGVTGFLFDDYTAADFMLGAVRAVDQYQEPEGWNHMIRDAMQREFGWEQSAAKYLNVYKRVVGVEAR